MTNFYTNALQYGNEILLRAVHGGERVQKRVPYSPYLFVKTNKPDAKYRSIYGDPAEKIEFETMRDAKEFVKKYDGIRGFEYYGMTNFVYPFLNDEYPGDVQYSRQQVNVVSTDIETIAGGEIPDGSGREYGFPDPSNPENPITAITLSNGRGDYVFLSIENYKPHRENIKWVQATSEKDLLAKFLNEWKKMDPDIVTGWNIEAFDIPYLVNRIARVLGEDYAKEMSPWKRLRAQSQVNSMGQKYETYDIVGVAVMDYMLIYKKWSFKNQESYRLDFIASEELGMGKLDYSEYGSLHELYLNDFQTYAEYNIRDTEIIDQLDEKMNLIDLVLAIAYNSKLNYSDAYTSVKMWDVIIHNHLMDQNIVVPQYEFDGNETEFVGGHVKTPIDGRHDWVASFDLNSLYPNLIAQYNISPDTYKGKVNIAGCTVDGWLDGHMDQRATSKYLKENNLALTPNGCIWDRSKQGFLGELMEKLYEERATVKKQMIAKQDELEHLKASGEKNKEKLKNLENEIVTLNNRQQSAKIRLNCAYGSLGNKYFRYFNPDFAESVTVAGQFSIRYIEKMVNGFLNKKLKTDGYDYVIASDTDSIYLRLKNVVDAGFDKIPEDDRVVDYLDKICSGMIEPFIAKSYDDMAEIGNSFKQKMRMKREAIASRGIWTGKKHYILNVYDNEGVRYSEPKLKVMGIEAVRSSTPNIVRGKIKEALKIIMKGTEDELISFVSKFEDEFLEMDYEQVAFPRTLAGLEKYKDGKAWISGTPIHTRGAFVFNNLIDDLKLNRSVQKLKDGDKIKFCYLTMPNVAKQNVISTSGELPKELDFLKRNIDYDMQFDKAFKSPLKKITDVIGWKLENVNTLEDLFG